MANPNLLTNSQKRLLYRAEHRGTKEMDWLLGKYVAYSINEMDEAAQKLLEAFLACPDPQLENWLMGKDDQIEPNFLTLINDIRQFHNLD